jgi:hypothetical protein
MEVGNRKMEEKMKRIKVKNFKKYKNFKKFKIE